MNGCPEKPNDSDNPYKSFNYKCYETCPHGTRENGNKSQCDPQYGFWYEEIKDNKPWITCSQTNCTSTKTLYRNNNKECIVKRLV